MFIKIEIDTREDLSDQDRSVLQALVAQSTSEAPKKTAAKKTAAKKTAATPVEDATPDPVEDATTVSEDTGDEDDMREALVARAAEILASGEEGKKRVIEALAEHGGGADRVRFVDAEHMAAFMAALSD